jgi:integrase
MAYRRPLEHFCEAHGDKPVALVNAGHLDRILGKMADRPGAANNLRKSLGRIFRYAVKIGWRRDNPATLTDPFKSGPGFHTWTEEEIGQFCAHWPIGTKPRLALELALNTAARRCDLVKIGRAQMVNGRWLIQHAKGGAQTNVKILPECQAAIDAMPVIGLGTLLTTDHGQPFTAAGFGNWFRDKCNKAGLPHCSAHGLRKAISRRVAESGGTTHQGRAITGHTEDRTFAYYAKAADLARMADAALANLETANLANRE